MRLSRRDLLKLAAAAPAAAGLGALTASISAPTASADSLGLLFDYAAGVLSAADIKAAGGVGAIRYVSDRRPGAQWMLGKPIRLDEARDLYQAGLKISKVIEWALQDDLGSWFWQHDWGSPQGFVHPAAHLHQFEIDARQVAGIGVDLNNILKPFGQWD